MFRHGDIAQHDVSRLGRHYVQGLRGASHVSDAIPPSLEPARHDRANRRLIVDNQHFLALCHGPPCSATTAALADGSAEAERVEPPIERTSADAKQFCGCRSIAAHLLQGLFDLPAVKLRLLRRCHIRRGRLYHRRRGTLAASKRGEHLALTEDTA